MASGPAMRAVLAAVPLALLAAALAPAAGAAVMLPEELCEPGQAGVCQWYAADGNPCVFAHLGTLVAGACTASDPTAPVMACSNVQLGLWDGWCWAGGNLLRNVVEGLP